MPTTLLTVMMNTLVLALAALPAVLAAASACNDNNCARAITGTRDGKLPIQSRKDDCSSYMTTTVYATPTATITQPIVYNRKMKRDAVTVTHPVPAYATNCADAAAYSSVCSCWGITSAKTTVTTPTTTVTLPQPTCKRGLEFAYYELERGTGKGKIPESPGSNYQNLFDTTSVKGVTPSLLGVGLQLSFSVAGCNHFDTPTIDGTAYPGHAQDISALTHRGYVYADVAGTYSVEFASDDLILFWVGPTAKSGWTVANSNAYSQYGDSTPGGASFTASLGEYVPIRVLYVNAQGCSALSFKLTKPDGTTVIFSSTGPATGNNVVVSCSGVSAAAPWPAFQDEN